MKQWHYLMIIAVLWGAIDARDMQQQEIESIRHKQEQIRDTQSELYDLDSIRAVVFTTEGTHIITDSDVSRPSLAGAVRSLEDMVFERLVYMDAKKFKVLPDEHAVDKYLASVQRENNLSLDDLKQMFASAGYSYEEGREQLKMMQAVNTMITQRVRSGLFVARKDVIAYYEAHPQMQEAEVRVAYAVVPYSAHKNKKEQKHELDMQVKRGAVTAAVQFGQPFWVKESEVAQDKQFLFEMKPGQVCLPIETFQGFELYRVVDKKPSRLRTLDERYQEIVDILIQPKYYELLGRYKESLFKEASVVYF